MSKKNEGQEMPGCGDDPYIRTHTGKKYHYLDPNPDDIDIVDIAYALSHEVRFAGHLGSQTVAQHCVAVASVCSPNIALHALLHDAEEAYLKDIPAPMKAAMRRLSEKNAYDILTANCRSAIDWHFGLDNLHKSEWEWIKDADQKDYYNATEGRVTTIWTSEEAYRAFMQMYRAVSGRNR